MKLNEANFDALNVDELGRGPRVVGSGKLDLVNAVTEQGAVVFPYRAKIVAVYSRVRTACGTGPGQVRLGKQGDDDYFGTLSHATTETAGTVKRMTLLKTIIEAWDVLTFASDGGATTTGDCDVVVITRPASPDEVDA